MQNIYHIASELKEISDHLDDLGLKKQADKIDTINKNCLKFVTAQYIGVQGYWIRQKRMFIKAALSQHFFLMSLLMETF